MIQRIEHKGILIRECSLPGETKADDMFPGQANAIRVSLRRWLLVYSTRGFRFIDDDRSIVYQLRDAAPDGHVIKEGFLSRALEGWQPFADGRNYFKQHGHPVLFGVPKDALIGGKAASHANVFVAKWRVLGIQGTTADHGTQGVEWVQFRLNNNEDDIEVVQPSASLGEPGMNQTFTQAIPFNDDASEWADVNHFQGGRIAALKYRFHQSRGVYECVESGPWIGNSSKGLYEASLLRHRDEWIVAARKSFSPRENGVAWMRSQNPFVQISPPLCPAEPASYAPITAYRCPDDVIRLFTGDPSLSKPPRGGRNPLRCWDINPADFSASNMRVIFDTYDAGLPMREACGPVVDMCKLLPHSGGTAQYLLHRVRPKAINVPANTKAVANAEEKDCAGVYYARIHYDRDYPGCWQFET